MPTSLGLVGITNKGTYNAQTTYVKGNFVYHNGSSWLLIANTATGVEPNENNSTTWQYLAKGFNVLPFTGATALLDGTGGTIPQPLAGDQDKVLQGNGAWGHKLQLDVVIQNNTYGYIGANNTFIPFKSQADIDAAVSAAKVGDATAADVLEGKTFTNSTTSGVTGTMPSRSLGTAATGSGIDSTGPYVYMPYGFWPEYSGKAGSSYTYMTAAQAVAACPKQEKTVTSSTSAQTVTPDSGKLLSKVTVNAMTNLSSITRYQHASNNATPTILGDAGYFTTVYDRISKANLGDYFEIRYNGSPNKDTSNNTTGNGYISTNTLIALPSQTKSVTAPASGTTTVSPDSNKVLQSVTVSPTPSQEKSTTASRSAQTITPDSGKLLSSVSIAKYPDASGDYTCGSNNGSASSNDMGATNNYRYVDATNVYKYGYYTQSYLSYRNTSADGTKPKITLTIGNNFVNSVKDKICIVILLDTNGKTSTPSSWGYDGMFTFTGFSASKGDHYFSGTHGIWCVKGKMTAQNISIESTISFSSSRKMCVFIIQAPPNY